MFSSICYIVNFTALTVFYYTLRGTDLAHLIYRKCHHVIQLAKSVFIVQSAKSNLLSVNKSWTVFLT